MHRLNIADEKFRYRALIGTGGIGSGSFFALNGNHTLGREESRSGGNMTTDNSACSRVSPDYVGRSEKIFVRYRKNGVALAVPEVGLDARKKILELGKENSFFCVASFTTEEMKNSKGLDLLRNVDLLAANIDEAAAASGLKDLPVNPEKGPCSDPDPGLDLNEIVKTSIRCLLSIKPSMYISITAGRRGSWVWDGKDMFYLPAIQVEAVSTAGAGLPGCAGSV